MQLLNDTANMHCTSTVETGILEYLTAYTLIKIHADSTTRQMKDDCKKVMSA